MSAKVAFIIHVVVIAFLIWQYYLVEKKDWDEMNKNKNK